MIRPLPDFGLLRGEEVTVLAPTVEYDEHMDEKTTWAETIVQNVLVRPGATSDVADSTRPDGTRAALTLGFPKSYTAPLRGCRISVRGELYEVVGDPRPLTPENVPGPWNLTVEARRVDG